MSERNHVSRRLLAVMFSLALVAPTACLAQEATSTPGDDGWSAAAPMPTPRSEIGAAAVEGCIYVAGGLAEEGTGWTALGTFEVYDTETDSWEEVAPLPVGLHHTAVTALGGRVYVSGGYDGPDFNADVAGLWAYDPESDVWTALAEMPSPRAAHAMVALGEQLYVVGGVGPESAALWVYDPETDAWDDRRAPLPTPREHLTAAVVDGRLYVIGGRWQDGNLPTLEVYDPETDGWTRLADMPTARGGITAATLDGLIHVTGGEALDSAAVYPQHEVYDPETDSWSARADLPTPRHGLASAEVEGRWYVIGGGEEAGGRTFFSLSDRVEVFEATDSE